MGWFDDDDDDSDEDNHKNTAAETTQIRKENEDEIDPLDAFMAGINSTVQKEKEEQKKAQEEEEDPLDAFMGNLHQQQQHGGNKNRRTGRLDLDNEEEATAHWTQPSSTNVDNEETAESSTNASCGLKAEMAMTFHRAGQKATAEPKTEEEEEDDLEEEAERRRKKNEEDFRKSLQTKTNHSKIDYPKFNKTFWSTSTSNQASHDTWRKQHSVQLTTNTRTANTQYDAMTSFEELTSANKLPPHLFTASTLTLLTDKLGYKTPTPIQAQTVPIALSGHDVLLTASTGSGKTLAYLLPLLVHVCDQPHIQPNVDGPIGLILVPTRELASQVYSMGKPLFNSVGGKIISFMGGQGKYEQLQALKKGVEVVVSTPGRLIDLFLGGADTSASNSSKSKQCANFRRTTFLVLDEADKMLDMGFEKQVTSILTNLRPDRQCMMLSATFGKRVERSANGWLCNPVRIAVGRTGTSSEHVTQHVLVLPSYEAKKQWLIEMFPTLSNLGRTIIFVSSRADCEEIAQAIRSSSSPNNETCMVDTIHGDKDQRDRNKALLALKKGKIAALVATDVAARGLDVRDIKTVVNFDVAKNIDSHVHRVGRAGRMIKDKTKKNDGENINDGASSMSSSQAAATTTTTTAGGEYQMGIAYTLLTPKNADFANLLMESFEREGREVSHELASLAMRSKKYGGGRSRRSKSGLGFRDDYAGPSPPSSTASSSPAAASNLMTGFVSSSSSSSKRTWHDGDGGGSNERNSYYGPASSQNNHYQQQQQQQECQQQHDQNQRQTAKRSRWGR